MHHGIYLGDGTVAHYIEGREISRSSLDIFTQGQSIKIVHHKKSSDKIVTLNRALKRIGEKKYNLLFNNCEHFANWCKTGFHNSKQIDDLINQGSLGLLKISQIIFPSKVLKKIEFSLNKDQVEKFSLKQAKTILTYLNNKKSDTESKLNLMLNQIDCLFKSIPMTSTQKRHNSNFKEKLIAAQNIADALTAFEDLTAIVNEHLKTVDT